MKHLKTQAEPVKVTPEMAEVVRRILAAKLAFWDALRELERMLPAEQEINHYEQIDGAASCFDTMEGATIEALTEITEDILTDNGVPFIGGASK